MKPYIPEILPITNIDYSKIIKKVGNANAELARYDGLLQAIVNPEVLLSPLTTNEAVLSSRIEGTQASLDDVLKYEAGFKLEQENKKLDSQEIINYRSTLILAEKKLEKKSLSLFLIRQMHQELMSGVRGADKYPGKFRTIQNWIGKPGADITSATFIPPEPIILDDHLALYEKYIHSEDQDVLVQASVVHAQFELLHPFLDGNGRIGRLLIPLFLFYKKAIHRPMFYISEYFENHRQRYYSKLKNISNKKDWNGWISFFLDAVIEQSKKNSFKTIQVLQLYADMREYLIDKTRSHYAIRLLDAMFKKPIFRPGDIQEISGIPKQSLMPMLKILQEDKKIAVYREAKGSMASVLALTQLLEITEQE